MNPHNLDVTVRKIAGEICSWCGTELPEKMHRPSMCSDACEKAREAEVDKLIMLPL